jgi:hypothetical protein
MRKIADVADRRLRWTVEWIPPLMMYRYELVTESGEKIAALRFQSRFMNVATVESGDGCWSITKAGFWHQTATVRASESADDLAVFRTNRWLTGGTVEFPDRRFRVTKKIMMNRLIIESEAGETLVEFHRTRDPIRIYPAAHVMKELPILVLLSWFLERTLFSG